MRLIDRATFNWGSEIQDLFVFALLLPEVGPKNSYHFLYQSEAKLKPITAWSSAFSRLHLTQLGCVTERCHWLLKVHVLSFLLIGCYDYWFYDTQSKRSLNSSVWSQFWKNSNSEILKRCSSKKTMIYISELTIPSRTFPKTTCLPSNQLVFTVVIKNCEPLVSLPALAILSQPGP